MIKIELTKQEADFLLQLIERASYGGLQSAEAGFILRNTISKAIINFESEVIKGASNAE